MLIRVTAGGLAAGVCLALAAVACSSGEATVDATPSVDDDDGSVELTCERAGYPCSWDDVPEAVFATTVELLTDAGSALADGATPEEVAATLDEHPDVATVRSDRSGVIFRLDGAPPVVAETDDASAVRLGADSFLDGLGAPAPPTATPTSTSAAPGSVVAATYEPPRRRHDRPRTAVVIEPFRDVDRMFLEVGLHNSGNLPLDEEITEEVFAAHVGRTEAALRASDHVDVTVDHGFDVFTRFDEFDLVVLSTHSSDFSGKEDCGTDPGDLCQQVLGGPVIAREKNEHSADFLDAMYRQIVGRPPGTTIGLLDEVFYIALTEDFFSSVYGPRGIDAIVILNACHPGGRTASDSLFDVMAGTASGDPAGTLFAWSDYVDGVRADEATAALARLLVDDGLMTSEAMEVIEDLGLDRHVATTDSDTPDRPVLRRHGRDLRARDVVTAETAGAELTPGATIAVKGEPDDGRTDVIRELTFLVEGVARGEEGDAVLTWQLPVRQAEPVTIRRPFESATGRTVEVVEERDQWRAFRIHLTNLDLEFDLTREDLVCCLEHRLVVEITDGAGAPSRHEVDPVFLREETVEVLDPDLGRPLADGDRVALDGAPRDGTAEVYPLLVRMDHLDERDVAAMTLDVTVGDTPVRIPSSQWDEVGDGTYEATRDVVLYDFPDDEEEVPVVATLRLPEGTVEQSLDPVVLELAPTCAGLASTELVNASLGTDFDPPIDVGGDCRWADDLSTFHLRLMPPATWPSMELLWASNDGWQVPGTGTRAFYDDGGGPANDASSTGADGRTSWSAFRTLTVETHEQWIQLQATGNLAHESDVRARLVALARAIHAR